MPTRNMFKSSRKQIYFPNHLTVNQFAPIHAKFTDFLAPARNDFFAFFYSWKLCMSHSTKWEKNKLTVKACVDSNIC